MIGTRPTTPMTSARPHLFRTPERLSKHNISPTKCLAGAELRSSPVKPHGTIASTRSTASVEHTTTEHTASTSLKDDEIPEILRLSWNQTSKRRELTKLELYALHEYLGVDELEERPPFLVAYTTRSQALPERVPFSLAGNVVICSPSREAFEAASSGLSVPGNPKIRDQLRAHLKLPFGQCPTDNELKWIIVNVPNCVGVRFIFNHLILEITASNLANYPSHVCGIPARYITHGTTNPASTHASRKIEPPVSATIRDTSSYLPDLHPGVILHDGSGKFSTAGLKVEAPMLERDRTFFTGSTHSFNGTQALHGGRVVGTAVRQFAEDDITVFESSDDVIYSNEYFEATAATTLLGWDPSLIGGWVELDSVTTGLQCFLLCGRKIRSVGGVMASFWAANPAPFASNRAAQDLATGSEVIAAGNMVLAQGETTEGMCGSPIVLCVEHDGDGAVQVPCLGFFWLSDGLYHFFRDLDAFISKGFVCPNP